MKFYYTIPILGTISAGKSTLLNGIFAKNFSQMNIRRTTMTPQIYNLTDDKKSENYQQIVESNSGLNKKYQNDVWDGETQIGHQVMFPSDFINYHPNIDFRIADVPGINDQSTKEVYMEWIEKKFNKFDLAILVVDISSGFNTSDEVSVLNLIFRKMVDHQHTNLIILVNKCDDMVYRDGQCETDEEKDQIYDEQVIPTIKTAAEKWDLSIDRIHIQKFCSRNVFIYRTITLNNFKDIRTFLDDKHLNEMMMTEIGRNRWLKMTGVQKEKRIQEMLAELREDKECYRNNMIHCGYDLFCKKINEIIYDKKTAKLYFSNMISNYLEKYRNIQEIIQYCDEVASLKFDDSIKEQIITTIRNFVKSEHFTLMKSEQNINDMFKNLKEAIFFEEKINSYSFISRKEYIIHDIFNAFYNLIEANINSSIISNNFRTYIEYMISTCKNRSINFNYDIIDKYIKYDLSMNLDFFIWVRKISSNYRKNVETFIFTFIKEVENSFSIKEALYILYKLCFLFESINEINFKICCMEKMRECNLKYPSVFIDNEYFKETNFSTDFFETILQ